MITVKTSVQTLHSQCTGSITDLTGFFWKKSGNQLLSLKNGQSKAKCRDKENLKYCENSTEINKKETSFEEKSRRIEAEAGKFEGRKCKKISKTAKKEK